MNAVGLTLLALLNRLSRLARGLTLLNTSLRGLGSLKKFKLWSLSESYGNCLDWHLACLLALVLTNILALADCLLWWTGYLQFVNSSDSLFTCLTAGLTSWHTLARSGSGCVRSKGGCICWRTLLLARLLAHRLAGRLGNVLSLAVILTGCFTSRDAQGNFQIDRLTLLRRLARRGGRCDGRQSHRYVGRRGRGRRGLADVVALLLTLGLALWRSSRLATLAITRGGAGGLALSRRDRVGLLLNLRSAIAGRRGGCCRSLLTVAGRVDSRRGTRACS